MKQETEQIPKTDWIAHAKAKTASVTIDASSLFNSLLALRPDLTQQDIAAILGIQNLADYTGKRRAVPSLRVVAKAAQLLDQPLVINSLIKNS